MRPRATEMTEHIRVHTPCLFKSIREDREPAVIQRPGRQMPFLIGGLSEADY
jgi:hypothetical protein